MEVKFGKIKPTNFNSNSPAVSPGENFFASGGNGQNKQNKKETAQHGGRINDYDSNILENNAYQDIPDETLRLEHKINISEKALAKINGELHALKGLADDSQIKQNEARKKQIEEELISLKKEYGKLGIEAKITSQISSVVNFTAEKKENLIIKTKNLFSKKIFTKISKKFNKNEEIKDALKKLSSINSNVDELITMQVPYGETVDRYDRLTAYLNKANVIHSQISKNLKEIKK